MSSATDRDHDRRGTTTSNVRMNSNLSPYGNYHESQNGSMFYNRYSHLDLDVYPMRISNSNNANSSSSSSRTQLDTGRCRHVDWELCEERRLQELEEVSCKGFPRKR